MLFHISIFHLLRSRACINVDRRKVFSIVVIHLLVDGLRFQYGLLCGSPPDVAKVVVFDPAMEDCFRSSAIGFRFRRSPVLTLNGCPIDQPLYFIST